MEAQRTPLHRGTTVRGDVVSDEFDLEKLKASARLAMVLGTEKTARRMKTADRAMRQIDLREYQQSEPHPLSVAERDALREVLPSLTIEPAPGEANSYSLTPSSTVGAVEINDLSVLIQPKIGIPQLLSLACYAMGVFREQKSGYSTLRKKLRPSLTHLPSRFTRRSKGILSRASPRLSHRGRGVHTVRGRIRFADQIRQRFGIPLPIEVRYDEFTDDIRENRLVKAAVMRLGGMRLRSTQARRNLGWIAATLENVFACRVCAERRAGRHLRPLNEHYRGVVGLSRLILRHSAFESRRGRSSRYRFLDGYECALPRLCDCGASGSRSKFTLRAALDKQLVRNRPIYLAESRQVKLEPDLTLWDGVKCLFVGDTKYKSIETDGVPVDDLYQMLAYATALNLHPDY